MIQYFLRFYFVKKSNDKDMNKTFVLHDESLNSQGYWMLTEGCDLSQFLKNPIMLWDHNNTWGERRENKLPIGHWENVRIKGKQILADPVFDPDEFSQEIAKKVEAGTLRMASVGAKVVEATNDKKYIKQGQRYETILKWKLKEASIVNFGSNDNALALSNLESNDIQLTRDSDCPLKELSDNPQNDNNMNKVKKLLELSDAASEQDVLNAISPLLALNQELSDTKTERDTLKGRLDAIELAEKEVKAQEAESLIDAALLDGRLNEDKEGSTKQFWLSAFSQNHEGAKTQLSKLPKHEPLSSLLSAEDPQVEGAFAKRRKEIDANSKR